jgi:hydroxyquinol 1,2-dioxygenase
VFGKRDSLVVDFDAHPPGKAVDGRLHEGAVPLGELRLPPRATPA